MKIPRKKRPDELFGKMQSLRETTPKSYLVLPDGTPLRSARSGKSSPISLLKPQQDFPPAIRGPWTFRIPAYYPPSLNRGLDHWSKAYRLKKQTAELLGTYALANSVPLVTYTYRPVRTMTLTVVGWAGGQTIPDPDNLGKFFRDACVWCRLLVDDGPEWAYFREPIVQRGEPSETVITITDVRDTSPVTPTEDRQTARLLSSFIRSGLNGKRKG